MKQAYLVLAVVGFIVPNIFVWNESVATGNWLLWLQPGSTLNGMFGNRISTAFIADLLIAVIVFCVFVYVEGRKLAMNHIWKYWLLVFLFGMAGTLPLFLYQREKKIHS